MAFTEGTTDHYTIFREHGSGARQREHSESSSCGVSSGLLRRPTGDMMHIDADRVPEVCIQLPSSDQVMGSQMT